MDEKWKEFSDAELEEQNEKLETEFKALFTQVHPEIKAKLDQAAQLVKEAVALSEKHGIPFKPRIGPFKMSYIPESLNDKLDTDFVSNLTGVWGYDAGWQYSQVC